MKKYLFLFLPMLALADDKITYKFVVDSPTMVEAYSNIFNAMAAFFQSLEYLEILKIVFLLGGLFTFCIGVIKTYQGGAGTAPLMDFVKYMIAGVIMLTLMFSQPASLAVVTNKITPLCNQTMASATVTSPGSGDSTRTGDVIANIPLALAWSFSFINELGRNTTRLAVTAFSSETVDLTSYSDASQFASYLSSTSTLLSTKLIDLISDTNAQGSKINLLAALDAIQSDCVLIPGSKSSLGNEMIHAFTVTGDLYQTMDDIFTTDTLNIYRYPYTPKKASNVNTPGGTGGGTTTPSGLGKNNLVSTLPGYTFGEPKGGAMEPGLAPKDALVDLNGEVMRCGDLWKIVGPELQKLRDSRAVECRSGLRRTLNGSTISVLTGSNSQDDNTTVLSAARQIGIQAGLMNHFMEAKGKILPGELNYATGKSIGDFVTSSLGTGYYMAKMLPYLQMGMRAILYAFFPFVFIVVLLPGGFKNLFQYAQTLIWIELWSPTAAILNMFLSLQTADSLQTLYNVKGLNMSNSLQVFSDATQMASIAGYLYASVPALTWLILKGSGYMLGNITNGVAAKMAANMDSRSINQDMQDIQRNKTLNEERANRGENLVNLAETDLMYAQQAGILAAGQMAARAEQIDKLASSSKGSELQKILSGEGQSRALKSKENQQAVIADIMAKTGQTREELIAKGVIDKNGNISQSGIDYAAKVLGTEAGVNFWSEANLQKLAPNSKIRAMANAYLAAQRTGQGISIPDALRKEALGQGNQKAIDALNKGDIVGAAMHLNPVGKYGQGALAEINDKLYDFLHKGGVSNIDKARSDAGKIQGELGAARAGNEVIFSENLNFGKSSLAHQLDRKEISREDLIKESKSYGLSQSTIDYISKAETNADFVDRLSSKVIEAGAGNTKAMGKFMSNLKNDGLSAAIYAGVSKEMEGNIQAVNTGGQFLANKNVGGQGYEATNLVQKGSEVQYAQSYAQHLMSTYGNMGNFTGQWLYYTGQGTLTNVNLGVNTLNNLTKPFFGKGKGRPGAPYRDPYGNGSMGGAPNYSPGGSLMGDYPLGSSSWVYGF